MDNTTRTAFIADAEREVRIAEIHLSTMANAPMTDKIAAANRLRKADAELADLNDMEVES